MNPRPLESYVGGARSLDPDKLALCIFQTLVQVSEVPFQNPPVTPSPEADNLVTFAEITTILIVGIPEEAGCTVVRKHLESCFIPWCNPRMV